MDDKQKIVDRLRALREKTVENGCTEGEAMAAAEKVEQLLREYAISRDELDVQSAEARASYGTDHFRHDPRHGRAAHWVTKAIAELCDCKVWRKDWRYTFFFGERLDADMAMHLLKVIEKAIEGEWFVYSFGRFDVAASDKDDFTRGVACRVADRLREMKAYQKQAVAGAGKGLVAVTKAMVLEREFAKLDLKIGKPGKHVVRDVNAFAAGKVAGDHVTFHQGVRHDGKPRPSHSAMPLRLGHG